MIPIIEIKNVGKKYNLTHRVGGYLTLRDVVVDFMRQTLSLMKYRMRQAAGAPTKEEFWALRDVNLHVNRGDVVGIIGANGAGKSTLLKILTAITPPTEGEVILRGRVASLLEVGTGFHPELTGRDNIFLNGAILGMGGKEIAQKFDAIVEFAGIARFLDMPVKYYSSGMYVRLAFSVAAHLEPDILLIDEVLAVGDAEFQKKCLGKMEEVTRKDGRTILFVSHNMGAIAQLCNRCVLLVGGGLVKEGKPDEVISYYVSGLKSESKEVVLEEEGNLPMQIVKMRLEDANDNLISETEMGNDLVLVVEYVVKWEILGLSVGVEISKDGIPLVYSLDTDVDDSSLSGITQPGRYRAKVVLPTALLKEGRYGIRMNSGDAAGGLAEPRHANAYLSFAIINTTLDLTHKSYRQDRKGLLYQKVAWTRVRL
jgi:lipopolysaccharide transport system ATP-binding protein